MNVVMIIKKSENYQDHMETFNYQDQDNTKK